VSADFLNLSTASSLRSALQPLENLPISTWQPFEDSHAKLDQLEQCTSCRVLARQVETAINEAAHLEMQTEEAHLAASRGSVSLKDAQSQKAIILQENAAMEQRCNAGQQDLADMQAVHDNTWARWREEVAAWRALHNDAQLIVDITQPKIHRLEQQRADSERMLAELTPAIAAVRDEVQQLHSVQSGLEAQSLLDTDRGRAEIQRLEASATQARAVAAVAREERAASEMQLDEQSAEVGRQLLRFAEYENHCMALEQEASTAKAVIEKIRQECIEERRYCSTAVELLDSTTLKRSERACSPIPGSNLVDMTSRLELCMERARTLEADNEAIRKQRQSEAEHCRHAVEHLRAKVRRYRARCDALRHSSPEEGSFSEEERASVP